MGVTRIQRISMPLSNQPKDQTVNSFYFNTGATTLEATPTQYNGMCTLLDEFFNVAVGAGNAVRLYIAESVHATQRTVYKVYDMDATPPRVPLAMPVAQNITPVISTAPLPSEVACCLSFRGPLVSGANAGRRRGRVYIGPLNTAALAVDVTTGQARPVTALQTALVTAANRMADAANLAGYPWGVYSPTARGTGASWTGFTTATYAWVDGAFDTQRRRGMSTSARTFQDL